MGAGITATRRGGTSLSGANASNYTKMAVLKGGQEVAPDFIRVTNAQGKTQFSVYFDWSTTGTRVANVADEDRVRDVNAYKKGMRTYAGHANAYQRNAQKQADKAYDQARAQGKSPEKATKIAQATKDAYLAKQLKKEMEKAGASGIVIKGRFKPFK